MNEAALITLTQALRNQTPPVEHRCWLAGAGDWRVQATSAALYTAAQLAALEAAHGVVASTNRAEFR